MELALKQGEIPSFSSTMTSSSSPSLSIRASSSRKGTSMRRSFQAMKCLSFPLDMNEEVQSRRSRTSSCSLNEKKKHGPANPLTNGTEEPISIFPAACVVLLVIASQIPNFRNDVCQLIDIYYHGLSFAIILCLLRSNFYRLGRNQGPPKAAHQLTPPVEHSNGGCTESSLGEWEDDTDAGGTSWSDENEPFLSVDTDGDEDDRLDEWGHFADLDESCHDDDAVVFSIKSPSLATLEEIAEEE